MIQEFPLGVVAHSDGDVVYHSTIDAILGSWVFTVRANSKHEGRACEQAFVSGFTENGLHCESLPHW